MVGGGGGLSRAKEEEWYEEGTWEGGGGGGGGMAKCRKSFKGNNEEILMEDEMGLGVADGGDEVRAFITQYILVYPYTDKKRKQNFPHILYKEI
jgi:hypothetical protein